MNRLAFVKNLLKKNPAITYEEVLAKLPGDRRQCVISTLSIARGEMGIASPRALKVPTKKGEVTLDTYLNKNHLSKEELDAVVSSARGLAPKRQPTAIDLGKTGRFRFAVISDTHIGHNKFRYKLWDHFIKIIKRDRCEFVFHPGDHLEGMSGRPGHVYELDAIGFAAQKKLAIELYSLIPIPMYGIDGNHDQWFKQKNDNGTIVGEELQSELKNYTHLGEWEGDLMVSGIHMKAFHANDGTAYAHSYKLQKLCESFTPTEKPDMVFSGHYHKALADYISRIYAWESGTMCGQSGFMRGKKLPAEVGFFVIEVEHHHGKILGVSSKFYHEDLFDTGHPRKIFVR